MSNTDSKINHLKEPKGIHIEVDERQVDYSLYNTISKIKQGKERGAMPIEIGERRADDAMFKNESQYGGYLLFEFIIIIAIVGIILAMSIGTYTLLYEVNYYKGTNQKIQVIKSALEEYRIRYGRLPCPADITIGGGNNGYMTEVANCLTAVCSTGVNCINNVAIGGVPAKTIGINDAFAIDAWNNKIIYGVDQKFVSQNTSNCKTPGSINQGLRMKNFVDRF